MLTDLQPFILMVSSAIFFIQVLIVTMSVYIPQTWASNPCFSRAFDLDLIHAYISLTLYILSALKLISIY